MKWQELKRKVEDQIGTTADAEIIVRDEDPKEHTIGVWEIITHSDGSNILEFAIEEKD